MTSHGLRLAIGAATSMLALIAGSAAPALAGGFAVREQSSEFQGMSYAGDGAAGGGLSGMYWNPAVAAYAPDGLYSESEATGFFGHVTETAQPSSSPVLGIQPADSGNISSAAFIPADYYSYRLSPSLVAALAVNSPFGLSTSPSNGFWAGSVFAQKSRITTYNATPTIAYRFGPGFSVGAGLQIEYMDGRLTNYLGPSPSAPIGVVDGHDTKVGYTVGANWNPMPWTSIGIGYRSGIDHELEGSVSSLQPVGFLNGSTSTPVPTPGILTLSARQGLSSQLTLTGTVEWSDWSRLDKLQVICGTGGTPACVTPGSTAKLIPLNWHNGWLFALGAEYAATSALKLRGGIAYEESPIQSSDERIVALPDQNRFWLSGGGTLQLNKAISVDLAYSHVFGLGGGITQTTLTSLGGPPVPVTLNADASTSADSVSGALKWKFGGGP
jgi:long-chain fatty acid transport protein